jgi:hypothetical protein
MRSAVVTGALERVEDVALALKRAGFEILAAQPDVSQIPAGLGEVDCYVQLPNGTACAVDQAVTRGHATVAHTMLARFDTAAVVAPMLASKATVVLVVDPANGVAAPDRRLERLLIEAVIADHGGDDVRVAVIDAARPPEEIAGVARSRTE